MKKILMPGLAAGLLMLAASLMMMQLTDAVFPNLNTEYTNPQLFRPESDPWMSYLFIHPFVMGLVLAIAWSRVKYLIKQRGLAKGAVFGLYVWVLFGIPGMLISLSTFQVSGLMVISWSLSGLIQDLVGGITVGYLNK